MSPKFEHCFVDFEPLETENIDGKRYYRLPSGKLVQSVTTVLGNATDKTALHEWRRKVGEEEANRVTRKATTRGTHIHSICEKYLLNEDISRSLMPIHLQSFKSLKPHMDNHIGKIFGIESPLYSEELNTAGRTDCICEYDGVPSIVDFKTSTKLKQEDWIENYFLQATCYSLMTEERTPLKIPQIVIIIAVDHEQPQVFIKNRDHYRKKVEDIFYGQETKSYISTSREARLSQ